MRMQQHQQQQQQQQADQANEPAQMQATRGQLSEDVHKGVGEYLQMGKCREAVNFALKYGQVDLATQARNFCAFSPAPASPQVAPAPAPAPEARKAEDSHVL
jgi:hypothetical protein